jgi:Arc/MetJ-type ribon-helix-helix transcriptional regulator
MPSREQRLTGRLLRYQLTLILRAAGRPMTVKELIGALDALGHPIAGRASKTVSDALRQEVRRGRVRRGRRATYLVGHIPESTVRWMREHVDRGRRARIDLAAS